MELNGKKINFLGDSITFGHGVADPENIYCNRIGKKYGATVRNYGISGTRFARQHVPSNRPVLLRPCGGDGSRCGYHRGLWRNK